MLKNEGLCYGLTYNDLCLDTPNPYLKSSLRVFPLTVSFPMCIKISNKNDECFHVNSQTIYK